MTFQQFIEKWNGHYVDFDFVYGNQCMDLEHQYCVEILGLTDGRILSAPAAKDVYNNFDNIFGHDLFERIPNTPTGVPEEGDIMFWGTGTWGHVAIFVEGDMNSFRSFDQNYPTGSPCHVQNHTYSGVLGWLRFKKDNLPSTPALDECNKQLEQEIKNKNDTWKELQDVKADFDGIKKQVEWYENVIKQYANILGIGADTAEIAKELQSFTKIEEQLKQANNEIESLKISIQEYSGELERTKESYKESIDELSAVKSALQSLKNENYNLKEKWVHTQNELDKCKSLQKYKPLFRIGRFYLVEGVN